MNEVPWKADVELTAATVGTVLGRQFPALGVQRCEFLNEGWDSFAFLADERWVFLFPKRQERERLLLASMRLLRELDGGLSLPVPRPEYWGSPCEQFPFHFVGYGLLRGSLGHFTRMPACRRESNAVLLGMFLSCLHSFPVDRARALGVPDDRHPDHAQTLLDEVGQLAPRLAARIPDSLRERCRPFLDGTIVRPPPPEGLRRLTHGDLQAEHILLDSTGAVCGVIDFGDATIADPASDYVGLCAWQGWHFARTAMEAAGAAPDQATERRVRFMAQCIGLLGLGWADWQNQEGIAAYRRFLENAFSDGASVPAAGRTA